MICPVWHQGNRTNNQLSSQIDDVQLQWNGSFQKHYKTFKVLRVSIDPNMYNRAVH